MAGDGPKSFWDQPLTQFVQSDVFIAVSRIERQACDPYSEVKRLNHDTKH